MSNDKPRRPLSYQARVVAHEWGMAAGLHCSAPHDELGIVHDHRCDTLADAITAAIERDRAERAGTGATRLRDVAGLVQAVRWAVHDYERDRLPGMKSDEALAICAVNAIVAHLQKAMPAAPRCGEEEPGQPGLMRYCSQCCNDVGEHVAAAPAPLRDWAAEFASLVRAVKVRRVLPWGELLDLVTAYDEAHPAVHAPRRDAK